MGAQSDIEALLGPLGIEIGLSAVHLSTGRGVAIRPERLFPTASVFKIPVMVEVFAQAEAGCFALGDRMAMPEELRTMGSGVMQKLEAGLAPTIRDLVMLMIIISDNTATEMLLRLLGPDRVTATMRKLGLHDIHVVLNLAELFVHAYGLPTDPWPSYAEMREASRSRVMDYGSLTFAASAANTTSSAADMANLLAMIHDGRAGSQAGCADMLTILGAQQLRDRVPRYLPDGAVANKTGTFRGIRNDAGLITRGEDDVIAFALFTFDRTRLPAGNSRALVERNILVNGAMAELGQILWDSLT
jgi:beta-lactamase class A